ncbi:MAG: YMGG-like glycine zipper-containing protein [Gemmatimonadales bacterium]
MTRVRWITLATLAGALALPPVPAAAQEEVEVARVERSTAAPIPAGTDIPVTLNQDVTVKEDNLDKTYEAQVTRDVIVDGDVVIRQGAPAQVRLIRNEENSKQATLRLAQVQIDGEMRQVSTENARADTEKDRAGTAKKTGIGAAAGAVIGAVTGVGVLKGAVIGAGGGLAWGLLSGRDREVDRGTQLEFELSETVNTR